MLGAAKPPTRTIPVVFDRMVAPSLVGVLLAGLSAEELLVQDVSGVHSGANPITGDFSVGVSGLLFRGGELAEPVREVTVAAHLLDILQGIEAGGSELRFTTGSIGGSRLLVGQMTVAGA